MNIFSCAMVIDDNTMDSVVLDHHLKNNQVADTVLVFSTATEALSYFRKKASDENLVMPEVIFLDINMPQMNGFEFLDSLNDFLLLTDNKILVVMITSSDLPEDKKKAEQYENVVGYVTKPVMADVFSEAIEKIKK